MTARPLHPAEIGFDFDGVIADTVEAFIRIACEQYGHCGIRPEDITHFLVEVSGRSPAAYPRGRHGRS